MASTIWQRANTWVFVVGLLEWENPKRFRAYSKTNRLDEKLVEFFKKSDIPHKQIIYLQDKAATKKAIYKQLNTIAQKIKENDTIFFYYCGHGTYNPEGEICFANYDYDTGNEFVVKDIFEIFDKIPYHFTCLLTADCCHSGALADYARVYKQRFAAITSVVPVKTSTGNWTFSNALLECLEGNIFTEPTENKGFTLQQTAEYIARAMAIVVQQKASFFIPDTLQNLLISTQNKAKNQSKLGEIVLIPVKTEEHYARIVDERKNEFQIRYFSYTNDRMEWIAKEKVLDFYTIPAIPLFEKVEVFYPAKGYKQWYEAKIMENYSNILYYVQYDIDKTYEWVDTNRIRKLW